MLVWWLACTGPTVRELPLEPAEVVLGEVVTCAEPALGSPYDTQRIATASNSDPWIWGGGLLVADLYGDAALEVWLTAEDGLHAYSVVDGALVEHAAPEGHAFGTGAVAADIEGDGDLDVFVTRWAGAPADERADGADRLLLNDGDGGFTEVGHAQGLDGCDEAGCTRSVPASFADLDHDGDLDLFVGSHGVMVGGRTAAEQDDGDPSHLYENLGDGTFRDVSARLPDDVRRGHTLGGGFVDLDADGWSDLLVANDLGLRLPNQVLWNQGGTLAPGPAQGLDVVANSMGLAVGDLNGDARPELVVPSWNEVLYLESGEGGWIEAGDARGVGLDGARAVTWGSELADLDNDGDLDLLTAAGWLHAFGTPDWQNPRWQPDLAWRNDGTPTEPEFVPAAAAWSLDDEAVHRAFAVADLDRDGFLDLLVHDLEGELLVHRARCTAASWLRVVLEDRTALNRDAVGAVVEIEAGGEVWRRTVRAGGTSMGVGLPAEVHVGLGSVERVARVVVHWVGGKRSEVRDLQARREVRVVRGR